MQRDAQKSLVWSAYTKSYSLMFLNDFKQILALDVLGYKLFVSIHTIFWRVRCQGRFLLSTNDSHMLYWRSSSKSWGVHQRKFSFLLSYMSQNLHRHIDRMGNPLGKWVWRDKTKVNDETETKRKKKIISPLLFRYLLWFCAKQQYTCSSLD